MSYGGRKGVNVSQYLRDLNVQEPAVEETFITDDDLAKDLALFTNTQFYDFETGQNTDYQAPPVKTEKTTRTQTPNDDVTSADPVLGDFAAGFDFMSGECFCLLFSQFPFRLFSFVSLPAVNRRRVPGTRLHAAWPAYCEASASRRRRIKHEIKAMNITCSGGAATDQRESFSLSRIGECDLHPTLAVDVASPMRLGRALIGRRRPWVHAALGSPEF